MNLGLSTALGLSIIDWSSLSPFAALTFRDFWYWDWPMLQDQSAIFADHANHVNIRHDLCNLRGYWSTTWILWILCSSITGQKCNCIIDQTGQPVLEWIWASVFGKNSTSTSFEIRDNSSIFIFQCGYFKIHCRNLTSHFVNHDQIWCVCYIYT